MRWQRGWPWGEIIGAVGIAIIVIVASVIGCREYNAKKNCRSDGGRVVEYDCKESLHCDNLFDAEGRLMGSHCYPVRTCKWRCDDLPAERNPR